jgi:hypothetical protein
LEKKEEKKDVFSHTDNQTLNSKLPTYPQVCAKGKVERKRKRIAKKSVFSHTDKHTFKTKA